MITLWLTAWVVSLLCAAGAWLCARRAGLTWLETLLFAAIFFPAPLFVAIGGGNSFIYGFDLVVPVALWLAARRWGYVPLPVKQGALWLLVGVGVVPLVVALTQTDRECILYAGINQYRLLGALSMMCVMGAAGERLADRGVGLLGAISWMNIVLVIATLAQSQGWINSNVFHNVANESSVEDNESFRFITAGLFRGSVGIIGTLGWAAFLAQFNARGWRAALALTGGGAGAMLIVLCGSKTSLFTIIFVTVVGCLLFRTIIKHLWMKLAMAIVVVIVVVGSYLSQLNEDYFRYTLGAIGLSDDSLDTFNYRHERWWEALEFVQSEPEVLLGVATAFGVERRMHYFHNEYLGLLMSGGIWSVGAYLAGLFTIGRSLRRRPMLAGNTQVFGGLTLLAGLVQASTVNHVAPGIFFGCTVLIIACAYGLGLARDPEAIPAEESAALEEWLEDASSKPGGARSATPVAVGETALPGPGTLDLRA